MTCKDIIDLGLWQSHLCCRSCHEDDEEYLAEIVLETGDVVYVCCALSTEGNWEAINRAWSAKRLADLTKKSE